MNTPLTSMLVVALLFCATDLRTARAGDVEWMTDTDKAVLAMRKEKKPLLIYLTSPNCHYCKKMKQETYRDPQVAAAINKSFVPVAVDHKDAKKLIEALNIRSYPTTVVISPDNKVLERINGYLGAKELNERLATLAKKNQTR